MKKAVLILLILLCTGGCGSSGPDETPEAFSFSSKRDVDRNTYVESNAVRITGFDVDAPISIKDGEYQINGGEWTSAPGVISPYQTLKVRHTSAGEFSSNKETTIKIGNYQATFKSKTVDPDKTPDELVFSSPSEPVSFKFGSFRRYSSNAIEISGIDVEVDISIVGDGTYSIDGVEIATESKIKAGQKVRIYHYITEAKKYTSILNVGPRSGKFSTTGKVVGD